MFSTDYDGISDQYAWFKERRAQLRCYITGPSCVITLVADMCPGIFRNCKMKPAWSITLFLSMHREAKLLPFLEEKKPCLVSLLGSKLRNDKAEMTMVTKVIDRDR